MQLIFCCASLSVVLRAFRDSALTVRTNNEANTTYMPLARSIQIRFTSSMSSFKGQTDRQTQRRVYWFIRRRSAASWADCLRSVVSSLSHSVDHTLTLTIHAFHSSRLDKRSCLRPRSLSVCSRHTPRGFWGASSMRLQYTSLFRHHTAVITLK